MAKNPRFRFETVHRVRKLEERNRKRELGILLSRLEQLISQRKHIEMGREKLAQELANLGHQAVSAGWALVFSGRIAHLDRQRSESMESEKDLHELIEEKRAEVEKALMARKGLDRLLEKHQAKIKAIIRKDEEKYLDEMTIIRGRDGQQKLLHNREEQ
jgi:flagellar export protein FliJ